jgi:hypothetical protein
MTCKDCKHFSNAYGGTCMGWVDLSVEDKNDDASRCERFQEGTMDFSYTPKMKEEYSEYDKIGLSGEFII